MKYKQVPLGEIADITMGQSPKSDFYNHTGDGIEFLQGVRTFGDNEPTFDTFTTKYNKVAKKGDILFSVRAPVGRVNWSPTDIAIGRGVCSLRIKQNFNSNYIFYYLKKIGNQLDSVASGTVFTSINKQNIEKIIINIPENYDDQQKIGDKLSIIDKKIEINNKINANLDELIFSYFKNNMLTNNKTTYITHYAEIISGGTPSKKEPSYYDNGKIAWITPKDLSNNKNLFVDKGSQNITANGLKNSSAKLIPKNSILFSSRAPIGYIAISLNSVATNQGFKSLVPKDEKYSEFIYYLMKYSTEKIISNASGSTFKEISISGLKNIEFPELLDSELYKFHKYSSPIFNKIKNNEFENTILNKIKNELLSKLLN